MSSIVITLGVLAWVISRQLSVRPLKERSRIGWVLLAIGVVETVQFAGSHSVDGTDLALLALSAAIGCVLALGRAFTVRLWSEGDTVLRQGTVATAVLWLVGLGQHLLVETVVHAPGLAEASLLGYFGLVLLVQRAVLLDRARHDHRVDAAWTATAR